MNFTPDRQRLLEYRAPSPAAPGRYKTLPYFKVAASPTVAIRAKQQNLVEQIHAFCSSQIREPAIRFCVSAIERGARLVHLQCCSGRPATFVSPACGTKTKSIQSIASSFCCCGGAWQASVVLGNWSAMELRAATFHQEKNIRIERNVLLHFHLHSVPTSRMDIHSVSIMLTLLNYEVA